MQKKSGVRFLSSESVLVQPGYLTGILITFQTISIPQNILMIELQRSFKIATFFVLNLGFFGLNPRVKFCFLPGVDTEFHHLRVR